jgi:hypothetical protein
LKKKTSNKKVLTDKASEDGAVKIKRKDGKVFVITPDEKSSPFDVKGINKKITKGEILDVIRESRER